MSPEGMQSHGISHCGLELLDILGVVDPALSKIRLIQHGYLCCCKTDMGNVSGGLLTMSLKVI